MEEAEGELAEMTRHLADRWTQAANRSRPVDQPSPASKPRVSAAEQRRASLGRVAAALQSDWSWLNRQLEIVSSREPSWAAVLRSHQTPRQSRAETGSRVAPNESFGENVRSDFDDLADKARRTVPPSFAPPASTEHATHQPDSCSVVRIDGRYRIVNEPLEERSTKRD